MRILNTISNKFVILTISIIVVWLILTLSFVSKMNQIISLAENQRMLNEVYQKSILAKEQIYRISGNSWLPEKNINNFPLDNSEILLFELTTSLYSIQNNPIFESSLQIQHELTIAIEHYHKIEQTLDELLSLIEKKGTRTNGLAAQIQNNLFKYQDLPSKTFSDFLVELRLSINQYLQSSDPEILENIYRKWKAEKLIITSGLPAFPEINGNKIERPIALDELSRDMKDVYDLAKIDRRAGFYLGNGIVGELRTHLNQTNSELINIINTYHQKSIDTYNKSAIGLIVIFIILGVFYLLLLYYFTKETGGAYNKISLALELLKKGEAPNLKTSFKESEFKQIAELVHSISDGYAEKTNFARNISEGKEMGNYEPGDALGKELKNLANKIAESRESEKKKIIDEKKRTWVSEGIAIFGEILRSERENIEELSYKVINKLVKYIDASQGSIFLFNDTKEKPVLDLMAAFAYDRRKYLTKTIELGVGLTGTCALEKETIFLTDIPPDYLEISSGLGQSPPNCLLIVPLKLQDEIFGIIEIASFKILESFEVDFVEKLCESISITFESVKINERTSRLLQQSQEQANAMAKQEEKMRKNMVELQSAQEESKRKESEITGILNAVNASSMVAEFNINGRFSDINEKFIQLLDSPSDQLIGKHHSDFAVIDKYSDEYKNFWNKLKKGEIINHTGQYRLYSGKEIWLYETFTPIFNEEGKVFKVLDIAQNITETKIQQEALLKQSNEIKRQSIDMRSLQNAVDESIIKCEYSQEGLILSMNDNYLEITGYSKKEMLGKNNRLFLKGQEKEQFETILSQLIKDKTYSGVVRRTKPTGEEHWLMSTFSPVKDEKGNIYKIYFLAQDITEKKLKYQLLEEANKEIERLKNQLS
jgi:PAS domain S-box-containing protein